MLSVTETLGESREELLKIIGDLSSKNKEQSANIHKLETQNEQLASKLHWFEEQFHLLRQKRFGKSSERTVPEQRRLFDEAEMSKRPANRFWSREGPFMNLR